MLDGYKTIFNMSLDIQAIIFDLDGTLIDTVEDIGDSMNVVLAQHGYQGFPYEFYKRNIGSGPRPLISKIISILNLPKNKLSNDSLLLAYRETYGLRWHYKTKPFNQIPELLLALKKEGNQKYKFAVLSNKPPEFTNLAISYFFPDFFDMAVGLDKPEHLKPQRFGPDLLTETFEIPPEKFLYVGDTDIDMKTAINAGMYPVGVLWGYQDYLSLEKAGASLLLQNPMDLVCFLKSH